MREQDEDSDDGIPMQTPMSAEDEFEVIGSLDLKRA